MSPLIAVRAEVFKAALDDPETCERIKKADTWSEIQKILAEFAEKQGFKVVYI
jgi:hypothetical protein